MNKLSRYFVIAFVSVVGLFARPCMADVKNLEDYINFEFSQYWNGKKITTNPMFFLMSKDDNSLYYVNNDINLVTFENLLLPLPSVSGYKFAGFYTAQGGNGYPVIDSNGNVIKENLKYAHITQDTAVTFKDNNEINIIDIQDGSEQTLSSLFGGVLYPFFEELSVINLNLNGGRQGTTKIYYFKEGDSCEAWSNSDMSCDIAFSNCKVDPPIRDGYSFLGYFDAYTGGNQWIDANGVVAKRIDANGGATKYICNVSDLYARWTRCGVGAGEYIDNGVCAKCPLENTNVKDKVGEGKRFQFVKYGSSEGIESCAVKLNPASDNCGDATNVVYVYNNQQEKYVRTKSSVFATETSVETNLSGTSLYDIPDSFCTLCEEGLYNINGSCGKCENKGYYLEKGMCTRCPRGYFCINGEKQECSAGTYSVGGAAECTACDTGYSTAQSGPVNEGFDGWCLKREGDFGVGCWSVDACKLTMSTLKVQRSANEWVNIILGNNIKIESLNKSVVQTVSSASNN